MSNLRWTTIHFSLAFMGLSAQPFQGHRTSPAEHLPHAS
jgi:hypothetical protein